MVKHWIKLGDSLLKSYYALLDEQLFRKMLPNN